MTDLTELLERAAPPVAELDLDAVQARVRVRRRRRAASRAAVAAAVVVALVGAVVFVGASGNGRQIDVEGGGHRHVTDTTSASTTTFAISSTTTAPPASLAPLPKSGSAVSSAWLGAVDMISPEVGVAVASGTTACPTCLVPPSGAPAALATTTDGGATWRMQGNRLPTGLSEYGPVQLAFSSVTTGDVRINGSVYVTTDGGERWAPLAVGSGVQSLTASGGIVWVLTYPATDCGSQCPPDELWTADLGSTTIRAHRPSPATDLMAQTGPDSGVLGILGTADSQTPTGLQTTSDQGRTWHVVATPCRGGATPGPLAAFGPSHWWLVCQLGSGMNQGTIALYETTDGGGTWSLRASASPITQDASGGIGDGVIGALGASADGAVVWATTISGIEETSDGGRTWSDVGLEVDAKSLGTFVTWGSHDAALLVPGHGLWRTTDGVHWQPSG
jgi:hypothetical protein